MIVCVPNSSDSYQGNGKRTDLLIFFFSPVIVCVPNSSNSYLGNGKRTDLRIFFFFPVCLFVFQTVPIVIREMESEKKRSDIPK